jgi:hypothetical protein
LIKLSAEALVSESKSRSYDGLPGPVRPMSLTRTSPVTSTLVKSPPVL